MLRVHGDSSTSTRFRIRGRVILRARRLRSAEPDRSRPGQRRCRQLLDKSTAIISLQKQLAPETASIHACETALETRAVRPADQRGPHCGCERYCAFFTACRVRPADQRGPHCGDCTERLGRLYRSESAPLISGAPIAAAGCQGCRGVRPRPPR